MATRSLGKPLSRLLVLLIGAAVAFGVVLLMAQSKRASARIEVEAAHSELELAFATLAVRLSSLAAALDDPEDINPDRFATFYGYMSRGSTVPRERAIAYMPRLDDAGAIDTFLARHAERYAGRDYPQFELFPPGETDPMFPAIMVEPPEARAGIFGFNMGSSPARVAAAAEALSRGLMVASAPVTLSQDTDDTSASFLLLHPVNAKQPDPEGGQPAAVLAASVTPAILFAEHVAIDGRNTLLLEIGIGGQTLAVTLGNDGTAPVFRLPLLRDVEMAPIRTAGFDVPFHASVVYAPRATDLAMPLLAGLAVSVFGALGLGFLQAREHAEAALQVALANKEAELREAYQLQARSQRVEALGRLVGGVAHDFNNHLSVVLGNLELIRETDTTRTHDPLIEEAIAATHRGARLTRQLLSVGRRSHLTPRPLDLTAVLQDSAAMLSRVLPASIALKRVVAPGLWPVMADEDALQNALLNLAINARDAMDGRGALTIEASNMSARDEDGVGRPDEELEAERYVVISVTDTGPGMSNDQLERAFEPFFSTKHVTDGSGLGLPAVLGFCKQSGGTCRIQSEPATGTTIRMILPAAEAVGVHDPQEPAEAACVTPAARILLVEDEKGVAEILTRQLSAVGYEVVHKASGDTAWAAVQAGQSFDLLISDLVMPGRIQGAELARRVEEVRPEAAVLLISGYPEDAARDANGVDRSHEVLLKPVPRTDLLAAVSARLARRA